MVAQNFSFAPKFSRNRFLALNFALLDENFTTMFWQPKFRGGGQSSLPWGHCVEWPWSLTSIAQNWHTSFSWPSGTIAPIFFELGTRTGQRYEQTDRQRHGRARSVMWPTRTSA